MTQLLLPETRPTLSRTALVAVLAAHIGTGWALLERRAAEEVAAPVVSVQLLNMAAPEQPVVQSPPPPKVQPVPAKATVTRVTTPEPLAAPAPEPEPVPEPVAPAEPTAPLQEVRPAPVVATAAPESVKSAPCTVKVKYGPEPHFPEQLKREPITMVRVALDVVIGSDGRARDIKVATSSGYAYVDDVVMQTLARRWRFESCRVDGRMQEIRVIQSFVFKLKG